MLFFQIKISKDIKNHFFPIPFIFIGKECLKTNSSNLFRIQKSYQLLAFAWNLLNSNVKRLISMLDTKKAKEKLGLGNTYGSNDPSTKSLKDYINLKLSARGFDIVGDERDYPFLEMGRSLLANFRERVRLLSDYLCPADERINNFLLQYLDDCSDDLRDLGSLIPEGALALERHGIARLLSIPPEKDSFESNIVSSYRVAQGVCHNPSKDRRTTQGVFHVVEGGLPIPADKKSVPKKTFARLLSAALNPPEELLTVPYTSTQKSPTKAFLSLLLRPSVFPYIPGISNGSSMEIRFFVPGNLVSNLDFVESIFGNAGDPFLPENDSSLDSNGWSGHTGCVILAPHLINLTKKELGLPHISEATERQKKDLMCWEDESEYYNDGSAFKITCRDKNGIIVTLIADNYYGYCKKEVKSQISYACNLLGGCEEEHAGGVIAFPSFDHGEDFALNPLLAGKEHTYHKTLDNLSGIVVEQPEGYAIDIFYDDIIYLPENALINQENQEITWQNKDETESTIKLHQKKTYVYPSGYKIELDRPAAGRRWRLVGTQAEGTFCHKPCTVSGGGKSEISKPLSDAMTAGSIIIPDFNKTMDEVRTILEQNYWDRYPNPRKTAKTSRSILSTKRSLGSVLKLLTPSENFTKEHNDFIDSISKPAISMALLIKRLYKPDWGEWKEWSSRFTEDIIDGKSGYELKYNGEKVITRYLRIGYELDGSWRIFSLRKDFLPAKKLQREDDISVSATLNTQFKNGLHPELKEGSHKFIENCEYRFFQRPDDAIHRGYDKAAEKDFSKKGNFFSNYEPLNQQDLDELIQDAIHFEKYSRPLKSTLKKAHKKKGNEFVVTSAHPRIVDGKPSQNPRYLQDREDLHNGRSEHLAKVGMHLYREISYDKPLATPVNAILPGRRHNPPNPKLGIRALAVYNPLHYQELPELFMDYIASLTGKSPSTTGAGSEGALTKGPFNPLSQIIDLNNALTSALLIRQPHFISAAGYVGPNFRVDHDISLIVPEVWSRMHIAERDPKIMIRDGLLESCSNLEGFKDASRLGYRITEKFVHRYFGRIFADPGSIFTEEMLRPELQDKAAFSDGLSNIVETQKQIAKLYFEDSSIDDACPPLKALLHIMAFGEYEGHDINSNELRSLFEPENLLESDWYQQRIKAKCQVDEGLFKKQLESLVKFSSDPIYKDQQERLKVTEAIKTITEKLESAKDPSYLDSLIGTIGVDPAVI